MSDTNLVEDRIHASRESPFSAIIKLMLFSTLMVIIPISTYYISKWYIFEEMLSYASSTSAIYAAIPAVISVNCVIAAYVYVAWHSEPWSDEKRD